MRELVECPSLACSAFSVLVTCSCYVVRNVCRACSVLVVCLCRLLVVRLFCACLLAVHL